jgi:hypothetical protein
MPESGAYADSQKVHLLRRVRMAGDETMTTYGAQAQDYPFPIHVERQDIEDEFVCDRTRESIREQSQTTSARRAHYTTKHRRPALYQEH